MDSQTLEYSRSYMSIMLTLSLAEYLTECPPVGVRKCAARLGKTGPDSMRGLCKKISKKKSTIAWLHKEQDILVNALGNQQIMQALEEGNVGPQQQSRESETIEVTASAN